MTGLPNAIELASLEDIEADLQAPMISDAERDHRLALRRVEANIAAREALIDEIRRTLPK